MSILIRGMGMPTKCSECLLAKLSPTGESLICNYMLSIVSWDERPFDCPLVPVPPHGRLIDADVAEVISFKQDEAAGKDFMDGILYAADWISKQPTIIEAEEGE